MNRLLATFPRRLRVVASAGAALLAAVAATLATATTSRPAMNPSSEYVRTAVPDRIAGLAFSYLRPVELALADDAATLDPEHPLNRRLREAGVGLTPRVLATDVEAKCAVIGAGAVATSFRLPFGWHVLDDGQRTLVFDAAGDIQINLNLRRARGDRALLEQVLAQTRSEQPQIEPEFVELAPGLPGLVLRNYRDGDEVLVQAFIVKQVRDDDLVHVARVTAPPEDLTRAMKLTGIILESLGLEPVLASR